MERKTNWIAVIVAVVAGMAIGFLWYGFLFTSPWMAGNGITMEGEKMFKNGTEVPMSNMPMIINLVAMFAQALLINWILGLTRANTWMEGAKVGGAIGLITIIGVFVGNLFAQNPSSLSMVDGSYSLLTFTLFGVILGGWQKK